MEHEELVADAPDQHLKQHLPSELYTRFVRDGRLPPALLAQECARLRQQLTTVASFVPHALVHRQLLQAPSPGPVHGSFWQGSLLVAKISGLMALCERLSVLGKEGAEEASSIIGHLFDGLVEDVHGYSGGVLGGGILKFSGNTFTAFFDATVLEHQHAAYAVYAALAMQARITPYTTLKTSSGTVRLGLRIGIHSGRLFAAEVGDAQHIELVVTGRQMNRVTLAQEIAAVGEIVITEETAALLDNASREACHPGFYLLRSIPKSAPPPAPKYWGWESGTSTPANLQQIAARIEALRPYLPHSLRAYPTSTENFTIGYHTVTALCVHFYPFNLLLDQLGDDAATAALILNAYYQRAQNVIQRYGGSITKVELANFGDKLIAVFGAPAAHEDDPLRAVRAALDLQQALHEANQELAHLAGQPGPQARSNGSLMYAGDHAFHFQPIALSQRIGISTGTVLAGSLGSALRRDYAVIGPPVALATQLAAAAGDGEIWLDPNTRYRVARHVKTSDIPTVHLNGSGDRLTPALVERLHFAGIHTATRFTSRPAMVGRDAELQLVLNRAAVAQQGDGQVIALVGDAGIGKTRLITEALHQLVFTSNTHRPDLQRFHSYVVECQSYDQSTPYAVVRELLRQILLLRPDTDVHQFYLALAQRLRANAPELYRFAPVLGDLLNLPVEETAITTALTPAQRHERTYDLFEALLRIEARRQPLVLVVDDLHWADASSFELLTRLARTTPTLPLLLIFSYRPGLLATEPWREAVSRWIVTLADISPEQSTTLVASLLGAPPPADLVAVLEQAQGNPFFIEELVYSLIEQDILQQNDDGWTIQASPDSVALPYGIEQVITARLERLTPNERSVIQGAAVIGRVFSASLLARVLPEEHQLDQRLESLEHSGFIRFEREQYVFRHTLLRDVTYSSIPDAHRRELHQRVAAELARLPEGPLELLARHTLLAEDWPAAFAYHLAAGRQAQIRHANHEALGLYETALAIVPRLQPAPADQLLELHERLGYIYALLGQHDAALASYDQALTLSRQEHGTSTLEQQVRLRRHIASVYEQRADYHAAFKWLESALALAGNTPSLELARCLLLGAGITNRQGKYARSLEWARRGLALAEQLTSVRDQAHALKLMAGIHGHLGDMSQAVELTKQSLRLYSEVQDLQGQAGAHINLGIFLYELGHWTEALAHYEAAIDLTGKIGNVHEQAMVANNLGDVLRSLGDLDGAIAQYQIAQRGWQHSLFGSGVVAMNLGAAYLQRGDLDLAAQQLDRSEALFAQAGAEGFLPELLRYRAELALARGDSRGSLRACTASLEHATRLGTRLEQGATWRIMGKTLASRGDLAGADAALQSSLAALREADSRYEIARTLIEIADLAPLLEQFSHGQAALAQALDILNTLGAHFDLERTQQIARRWNYAL